MAKHCDCCACQEKRNSRYQKCEMCGETYDVEWKSACAAGMCQGQEPPRLLLSEKEQRELKGLLSRFQLRK